MQAERNQCRCIPELHRPSARSATRAARARPLLSRGLAIFQKFGGNFPVPARTRPARDNSRNCIAVASPLASFGIGTNLATGLPRSITNSSSPAFTFARHALNVALIVDTAARFMKRSPRSLNNDQYSPIQEVLQPENGEARGLPLQAMLSGDIQHRVQRLEQVSGTDQFVLARSVFCPRWPSRAEASRSRRTATTTAFPVFASAIRGVRHKRSGRVGRMILPSWLVQGAIPCHIS